MAPSQSRRVCHCPNGEPCVVFSNRLALFLWLFMATWLGLLSCFTWLFVRTGVPVDASPLALGGTLAFFWLVGLGAAAWAASKPLITVHVGDDAITLARFYPYRKSVRVFRPHQLARATTTRTKDSDGDAYFIARAIADDGTNLDLHEGHFEHDCDAACARFNEAVFGRSLPPQLSTNAVLMEESTQNAPTAGGMPR
jgi:hypothetical protein